MKRSGDLLDASQRHAEPLTLQRIFDWHALLFPSGRSGFQPIVRGRLRHAAMEVVSGQFGRPKVHFVAPPPTSWSVALPEGYRGS